MITIYRLKLDKDFIKRVQAATLTTEQFGIQPTHGLFGSRQWWESIRSGKLPVHHLEGIICKVYMGSMNDWPEFTMRTDDGRESSWSRYANDPAFAALYTIGRRIEIDYVIERSRYLGVGEETHRSIPIEIRVGENVEESPNTA